MRGLFITGTDTGVGKTVVTAGIARLLRKQGKPVRVSKPVATGATLIDGRWLSEDTVHLAQAIGETQDHEEITPWSFPDPVAPPVAARRQGIILELPKIVESIKGSSLSEEVLLVEGVGGLFCPLTDREVMADLAVKLKLPLLLVARRSLGTLNHTLLTLEAARSRRLRVAGVVVSETERPGTLAEATNVEELQGRISVPILAVLPFQEGPFSASHQALDRVNWWKIAHD